MMTVLRMAILHPGRTPTHLMEARLQQLSSALAGLHAQSASLCELEAMCRNQGFTPPYL